MKVKKKYKILIIILLVIALGSWLLGFGTYQRPRTEDLRKRITYLQTQLNAPADTLTDLILLHGQNPEWGLFSLSFTAFAFTNIAMQDTGFRQEAAAGIEAAISKALSEPFYSPWSMTQPNDSQEIPEVSVLYLGHLNLMLGCHRLLVPASRFAPLHDRISASLHARYQQASSFCLESYPGVAWIPDNTVALASLKLHSNLTGSTYGQYVQTWVAHAQRYFTDPTTGVLYSTADPATGEVAEEPRGSMAGWSIFFLYRADSTFAREQYEAYKSHFSTSLGAIRLFKERYQTHTTDMGDIDSGPLILGFSIPANAFAFGGAVAMNDLRTARQLHRLIRLGSTSTETDRTSKQQPRLVDLDVNPLADALLLYFETMVAWK